MKEDLGKGSKSKTGAIGVLVMKTKRKNKTWLDIGIKGNEGANDAVKAPDRFCIARHLEGRIRRGV